MKSILNGLGILFSFVFSVTLYITIIGILLVLSVKNIFSFKTINNLIQNIDVKTIINDVDGENDIIDSIYRECELINISRESADLLLNSIKVKFIVSEYVYGGINYLTTGSEDKIVTEEYFKAYINSNLDGIIKDANIEYNNEEIENIKKIIIENSNVIFHNVPDAKDIVSQIDKNTINYIRFFFSSKSTLILLSIVIILLLLICLCRWSIYKCIGWFGVTCLFSSMIGFVVGLLPMFNFSSLFNGFPIYLVDIINSSKSIISMCFVKTSIYSVIIAIIILIIHFILKKRKEKNCN